MAHQVGSVDDRVYKNNKIREEERNVEDFETDEKIESFEKEEI